VGLALVLLCSVALGQVSAQPGVAQEISPAAWERLPASPEHVRRLLTPASGPLFALADDGLYRSDDGGDSWTTVSLPSSSRPVVAIDSTHHDTMYAVEEDGGLARTSDGGATWTTIRPRDDAFPASVDLAVSPADPSVLYLVQASKDGRQIRFLRSHDSGASWEIAEQDGHSFLACQWSVLLLQPHPADSARLFRSASCPRSGGPYALLQESRDQATSWIVLVGDALTPPEQIHDPLTSPTPTPSPRSLVRTGPSPIDGSLGYPRALLGGNGTLPGRFYVVFEKDDRGGGSTLLRSDDDGQIWTILFDAFGGGSATPPDDPRPDVTIGGLAYDPATPDRLYAAFAEHLKGSPGTQTVRVSEDAGQTWIDLGVIPVRDVRALALGIDGANLYAATDDGVWRLKLR